MTKIILLLSFFILFVSFSFSQEICNNGIDDDADGLIDLNDVSDCTCSGSGGGPPVSLIPNPSFESNSCCPASYSELYCADGWVQASDGTSDYYNTCGFIPGGISANGLLPFPDGNGVACFIILQDYKEYIASCLLSPLIAGTEYTFQMSLACVSIDPFAEVCPFPVTYENIDLTLYGASTCGNIPYFDVGCPQAPFSVIGNVTYTPTDNWSIVNITFTPTFDVNEIILGSPCTLPASYPDNFSSCFPYFAIDNIIVNSSDAFGGLTVTSSGALCTNDLMLNATTNNTGGVWQWYQNGIAIVGQNNPTLDISSLALGAGDYSATYIVGADCARGNFTVSSSTNPVVAANSETTCSGGSVTLTATGATTYTWSPATGLSSTTGSTVTATPTSTTTYTVTGTTNGCSGSTTSTVTIAGGLSITTTGSTTSCPNQPVTLTASGATNYSWSPATGLSSTTGNSVTSTVGSTTTYTVIGTSNGCTGTSSATITIVDQLPITVTSASVCPGQSAVLTASGAMNYTWTPATDLNTTSGNTVVSSPTQSIIYTVTGTAFGCTGSAVSNVVVYGGFEASASATPNPVSILDPTTTFISNSNSISTLWIFPDGSTSSVASPTYTFPESSENQIVTLVATSADGCIDTTTIIVFIEEELVFYIPNSFTPDGDEYNNTFQPVFTSGFDPFNFNMTIFNRWGEIIFETEDASKGWDGTYNDKLVQEGVYSWIVNFKSPKDDERFEYQGHVLMLK